MKKTYAFAAAAVLAFGLILVPRYAAAIELDQYLEQVKANHPFFQKEQLAVEVERSTQETLQPRYEWQTTLTPQYTIADIPVPSEFFENLTQTATLEASVARGYASGRQVTLSASSGYTWYQNPPTFPASPANSFQHSLQVSLYWPLRRNLERQARLEYDLQEFVIRIRQAEILETQEEFLVEPATLFVDWAYALELVEIYGQRRDLAEEQLAMTDRMYRSNLVDRVDVMRAEDAVRTAEQAIVEYQSQAKSIQSVLAILAGTEQLYQQSPDFEFYTFRQLPEAKEAADRGKDETRLKTPLLLLIEQLRFQSEAFAEREKSTLDLTLAAGLSGPQEELGGSLEVVHPQASVALSYSPVSGSEQLAADRMLIRTQIMQLDKEIESLEKNVETGLRSILIQASELEKVITLNRELIASAEEKAEEEARLYGQGRNMLTNVIQSRDSVQDQKARLVDNFARYHRLVIRYRSLVDQLLD